MRNAKLGVFFILSFVLMSCTSGVKPQDTQSSSLVENITNSSSTTSSNSSAIPDVEETGSVTSSGEIATDNSFFGELKTESQGLGSYKIVGALKGDFKNISVVWRYNGKEDEPYVLKKYIPEKRVFEYYVQPKFKTIQKGENTYIFTGQKANGEKESKEVTIKEDHDIVVSGKYCVLDICINPAKPSQTTGDTVSQTIKDDSGETETTITVNVSKGSASIKENGMMYEMNTTVTKYPTFFVRQSSTASCGPSSWKQEIFDMSGKNLHNIGTTLGIPQKITIGTKVFSLEDLNNDTSTYIYGTLADNKALTGTYTKDDATIGSQILAGIKKDKSAFPKKYTLSFKEYPEMKFIYSMKDTQPERVVYLGTDISYLKSNINSNGGLLDEAVNNKILSYYGQDRGLVRGKDLSQSIATVSKSELPIFNVQKLTNDGYYLLYPRDGYTFESFAEMCKPVVYVYKKEPTNLSVSLNLFGNGFFTKLIPTFSTGTTWNIETQTPGLLVDKKPYEYLYYSVKVKDYRFNKDGWIIQGNEAVSFFEDKLPKLGFKTQEQKDFIDFWKDQFKEESYYFVSFKYNKEMDSMVGLSFSKQPKSIERVLFEGYEIPSVQGKESFLYKNVRFAFDSRLLKTFHRDSNFDVFEWGGVLKDNENTIIR